MLLEKPSSFVQRLARIPTLEVIERRANESYAGDTEIWYVVYSSVTGRFHIMIDDRDIEQYLAHIATLQ